jgi:hypothetical protein
VEGLLYPLENEDFVFCLYLPYCVGVEVLKRNLTRCQRASKGAKQSAARRGDEVVEGGGMRFFYVGRDPVVLCDLGVDTEEDRLFPTGDMGAADSALHRLYPDFREVGYIAHVISFPYCYPMVP